MDEKETRRHEGRKKEVAVNRSDKMRARRIKTPRTLLCTCFSGTMRHEVMRV
jgi:hypothetical protein